MAIGIVVYNNYGLHTHNENTTKAHHYCVQVHAYRLMIVCHYTVAIAEYLQIQS